MINFSETNLYSDQPVTCPNCGLRSEIILDLSHTINQLQVHRCPGAECRGEFVMQCDENLDLAISV